MKTIDNETAESNKIEVYESRMNYFAFYQEENNDFIENIFDYESGGYDCSGL